MLSQKSRRRAETYRSKSHGGEPQRNHQSIRRPVRVRRVHEPRCAADTFGGQVNEPVPCRRHSHRRKKINQLQERNQRENGRIICRHLQIFNSVVCVRKRKQAALLTISRRPASTLRSLPPGITATSKRFSRRNGARVRPFEQRKKTSQHSRWSRGTA